MNSRNISSLSEDIIVDKLILCHDPDGRWLDSEMLLEQVEAIFSFVLQNDVSRPLMTNNLTTNMEVFDSKETLPYALSRISVQMLCPCMGENEIHTRTMVLFDLLKEYRWDAKAVLVLGVLAVTYGGLLLPIHLASSDPIAASIAVLSQLPVDRTKCKPWLNSLSLLIKAMVAVTKCIIEFERLPFKHVKLDNNIVGETISNIYLATYRVVRSALPCLQQIPYYKQNQQATESRRAAGELSSLGYQLRNMHARLSKQVEECSRHIEEEMYQRLRYMNKGAHQDNQEVLHLLFPLQDELPLQQYSTQIAISELKGKVILVLLAKPQVEYFQLLLQQLYDHPCNTNKEQEYEILWIPIPSSQRWREEEKGMLSVLSNSLPWMSVRRPWLMSSRVVEFLRREWAYGDGETKMVVMDSNGRIVNMNGMDMALIWGVRAYPFTVAREEELWGEGGWSTRLLLDGIHPVKEEGTEICITGSEDEGWVEEIKSLARKLQRQGFQFELLHLSRRTHEESSVFFWLRLQAIKRSKLRRVEPDRVLQQVSQLLDFDYDAHKGWAIAGKGSTAATEAIVGEKVRERMRRIVRWGECARGLGFTEAIQNAAEERPCQVSRMVVVPFEQMGPVTCQACKWPMKKFLAFH